MSVDIRRPLKKYLGHLTAARDANLNEADTAQRLVKIFEDVLGYNPMGEITREMQVKDKYVDIAIKIEGRSEIDILNRQSDTRRRTTSRGCSSQTE